MELEEDFDPTDPVYEPDDEDKKKLQAKSNVIPSSKLKKDKPVRKSKATKTKTKPKSHTSKNKQPKTTAVPCGEAANLLMQMEYSCNNEQKATDDLNASDDSDEFEEVEEGQVSDDEQVVALNGHRANVGTNGIDIRVGGQVWQPRVVKQVSQVNAELDMVRMAMNRQMKQVQRNLHCVHVMCVTARQHYLWHLAANPLIRSLLMSIELDQTIRIQMPLDIDSICSFLSIFHQNFKLQSSSSDVDMQFTIDSLTRLLQFNETPVHDTYTFLCFAILHDQLRAIGQLNRLRLCHAIEPVPIRPDFMFAFNKEGSERIARTIITKKLNNERPFKRTRTDSNTRLPVHFWFELLVDSSASSSDTSSSQWISIEPINRFVNKNSQIETNCFQYPVPYVLAMDCDRELYDITQSYCQHFFEPRFRKTRDEVFLLELLQQNGGHVEALSAEPDQAGAELVKPEESDSGDSSDNTRLVPLPKTVGSFKNHPVYVLSRHFLKYEVLYPDDAPTYGEFRGEPVYLRKNVHIAHSKDYWKREARVVRDDEQPYKITTARPKWDKNLNDYLRGLPLELYGEWQTEPYDPPEAIDGKVPRNEFHNVDLFKPQMLPKGCVHLRLNGLLRIASKLGIDCAAAVTGFDVSKRGTIPVTDGFVVCKEYEQVLIDAWKEEQINLKKREQQRYEARVMKNWKKLINLARARIRIKNRYQDMEDD